LRGASAVCNIPGVAARHSEGGCDHALSDVGRTFQPASGGGTDRAWGSHHFILGDTGKGASLYREYPQLGSGGPNDAEKEGRSVPAPFVDQDGATVARWFGVAPAAMSAVFPNIGASATNDLGFTA